MLRLPFRASGSTRQVTIRRTPHTRREVLNALSVGAVDAAALRRSAVPVTVARQSSPGDALLSSSVADIVGNSWPSVVVRAGTSSEGLPVGVQLVAQPWREDIALAAGRHLELALGPWTKPGI